MKKFSSSRKEGSSRDLPAQSLSKQSQPREKLSSHQNTLAVLLVKRLELGEVIRLDSNVSEQGECADDENVAHQELTSVRERSLKKKF
jgi:hypothetical protein